MSVSLICGEKNSASSQKLPPVALLCRFLVNDPDVASPAGLENTNLFGFVLPKLLIGMAI
jgi:hypothetical protein